MGRVTIAIALVAMFTAPGAQAASEPAIGIGEVSTSGSSSEVDTRVLRAMVTDAVGLLDPAELPRGRTAVLSVTVVRLESRGSSPTEVTCVVSATLRDRDRGALYAILEGSARGQDEPRRMHALERATLRAAVGSAIARVPEAMRRAR